MIERIVRLAAFQREDKVLEIGTGKGHPTEALCKKAGKVCSVEIDRGLLTKRQVTAALKQAGLYHVYEDGVTLYIQWLCLFRCYQRIKGRKQ